MNKLLEKKHVSTAENTVAKAIGDALKTNTVLTELDLSCEYKRKQVKSIDNP